MNNYTRLSFNFGPTLLSWMGKEDPETLASIVTADQESLNRIGHGNAIAQAYNHIIMPLADERDRETQVRWGIADFRLRFGRSPDAMWMPETAVDVDTLALLQRHGMKYAILSPYQAAEIEGSDGELRALERQPVDPSQPYYVRTAAGRMPVFFYHGELAADVSFGHLLRSSEGFIQKILAATSRGRSLAPLVNIATDGEIYGHHEPFGDMCLAHLFHVLLGPQSPLNERLYVTNYAAYLADNPPQFEVQLKEGATSWSCAHGVERWRADCGCRTGNSGFNQAWRKPLRESLDELRTSLRALFEKEGSTCLHDPYEARNHYIGVIQSEYAENAKAEFARRWFIDPSDTRGWALLESQRNAQLMYTSCGWFFDELSGIEPRQILLYAARAIDAVKGMASSTLESKFLQKLKEARSNIPEQGDGAGLYTRVVEHAREAPRRILNHHVLTHIKGIKPHTSPRYHVAGETSSYWTREEPVLNNPPLRPSAGPPVQMLGRGLALVRDTRTEEVIRFAWAARFEPGAPATLIFETTKSNRWAGGDPRGRSWDEILAKLAKRRDARLMGLHDLFFREAKALLREEFRAIEGKIDDRIRDLLVEMKEILVQGETLGILPDAGLVALLSTMNDFLWAGYVRKGQYDLAARHEAFFSKLGLKISKTAISREISESIDRQAVELQYRGSLGAEFAHCLATIRAVQELGVKVESTVAQEVVFQLLKGEGNAMIGAILAGDGDAELHARVRGLIDAAERLYIEVREEKKLLETYERDDRRGGTAPRRDKPEKSR